MRKIRDALRLSLCEDLSFRQISASLQIPHTTVADYVKRANAAGLGWPLPEDLDDDALEARLYASAAPLASTRPLPDWPKIHIELRRPHVTLMLLWHEYRETFPDGYGYSQFCERYSRWHRHLDVVMRQSHKAGEKLFVDFPGRRIPIYDAKTGEVMFEAELFVAVLGASSYLYAEAFPSQELIHWVTAHVHTFESLGGCPAIVVCDNLRSGVTKAHRYEPDINATYQEMATHYLLTEQQIG
jgi:transposase